MAKITRSLLKEIVKECLVELLLEGIDPSVDNLNEITRPPRQSRSLPIPGKTKPKPVSTKKQPLINESVINGLTSDPTMAEIFKDTAQTTLQSQGLSNSQSSKQAYVPADSAASMVYNSNPEDLFPGSNNWAQLAFSNSEKNS